MRAWLLSELRKVKVRLEEMSVRKEKEKHNALD